MIQITSQPASRLLHLVWILQTHLPLIKFLPGTVMECQLGMIYNLYKRATLGLFFAYFGSF